jgi:anti-sigma regulatory factor (Ser/Thr protein kinase)
VDFRQTLPASPNASALARKFLDGWLTDLVGKDTADAARVAASEIVDNAVQHGGLQPADTISLVGSATDEVVRVEVEQPTPASDVLVVPAGERGPDQGGFGLRIVEGLSSAWGVRAGTPGAVWFEVVREASAGRAPP